MKGWSWISWTDRIWVFDIQETLNVCNEIVYYFFYLLCRWLGMLIIGFTTASPTSIISWIVLGIEKNEINLSFFSLPIHSLSFFIFFISLVFLSSILTLSIFLISFMF